MTEELASEACLCTPCVLRIKCWKVQLWELSQSHNDDTAAVRSESGKADLRELIKKICKAHFVNWKPEKTRANEIDKLTKHVFNGGHASEDYLKTYCAWEAIGRAIERERKAVAAMKAPAEEETQLKEEGDDDDDEETTAATEGFDCCPVCHGTGRAGMDPLGLLSRHCRECNGTGLPPDFSCAPSLG